MPVPQQSKERLLELDFFQATDVGCVREANEDAIGSWPYGEGLLFAVADGLGGHNSGEEASALALEVLAREMHAAASAGLSLKSFKRAVQQVNLEVYQKSITVPELHRMGTTLTATMLTGNTLLAVHCGDSRLYLCRSGKLSQLTRDHTSVQEQVEYGILTPEEARTHPDRHRLTNYIGHDLITSLDTLRMAVEPGDLLVQCTDGIYDLLSESDWLEVLQAGRPEIICRTTLQRCRDGGGPDNMSLQVTKVVSCPAGSQSTTWWRFWS